MSEGTLRILSDLHLGDRASRLRTPAGLAPLFDGVDALVFNGDSLDTRPGPEHLSAPALAGVNTATAGRRAGLLDFLARHAPPSTLLTGNHDPDLTARHFLELAGGGIFVTHGDILFDDVVPWGRDGAIIRPRLARELAALAPAEHARLEPCFAAMRRVCAGVAQRHQSETRSLRYALSFVSDTAWPPNRVLRIFKTWRETARHAEKFMRAHRPHGRFLIMGHTHRPGVTRAPGGLTVINTGSFCRPFGGCAVDLADGRLTVRRIVERRGAFWPGEIMAAFTLAPAAPAAILDATT